ALGCAHGGAAREGCSAPVGGRHLRQPAPDPGRAGGVDLRPQVPVGISRRILGGVDPRAAPRGRGPRDAGGGSVVTVEFTLNGRQVSAPAEPNTLLLDLLRDHFRLTGAKRSCDVQVCGSCTVLVDGGPVSSCTYLAHEAAGREVLTIEGFAELPEFERFASA